jgi:hypothetical protein
MANSLMTYLEKANQTIWSLKQEIEKLKSESKHAMYAQTSDNIRALAELGKVCCK